MTDKVKPPAIPKPKTDAEASELIRGIGTAQRTLALIEARMAAKIATVKHDSEALAAPLNAELKARIKVVKAYCKTNRTRLLEGGGKSHEFPAGEVRWRATPAKVSISGDAGDIIADFQALCLDHFLRTTTTLDKESMLADPENATRIDGVTIQGGEQFEIAPFDPKLARGAKKKGKGT